LKDFRDKKRRVTDEMYKRINEEVIYRPVFLKKKMEKKDLLH